jgi:YHS domain-containing protein
MKTIHRSFLLLLLAFAAVTARAEKPVNATIFGVAIKGYDPVAYFTEARPVKGDSNFSSEWNGATWHFASAAHRDTFQAAPEKYAPQYGGYCAWAVSQGYTASIDPDAWKIVEGKLYLNYSAEVQKKWSGNIPGNIVKADVNWPKLLQK